MKILPLTGNDGDFDRLALRAASTGKLEALRVYLGERPEWIQRIGPHGRTLMWEAARKGKSEVLEFLLDRGADPSVPGCYFSETFVELTPLAIALANRRRSVVERLGALGLSCNAHEDAFLGNLESLERKHSSDPTLLERELGLAGNAEAPRARPIHYAVAGEQAAVVAWLLERKVDVVRGGGTLLRWAEWRERVDWMEAFLERGARPIDGDQNDWLTDPELRALGERFELPMDINAPIRDFPPLVDACRGNHNEGDDLERVDPLLALGADVNVRDKKEKTPLHRAAQAGFEHITLRLIEAGADLEALDEAGESPAFDAVRHGRPTSLRILLAAGARTDVANRRGQTLFDLARRSKKARADGVLEILAQAPEGKDST